MPTQYTQLPLIASKRCTKCNETKPLAAFSAHARMRDGLQQQCKDCVGIYKASVRERDKEANNARHREWKRQRRRKDNPAYYERNERRELLTATGLQICSDCHEAKPFEAFSPLQNGKRHHYCRVCAGRKAREWDVQHREHVRERSAQYYERNADHLRAYTAAWAKANPSACVLQTAKRRARKQAATVVPFTVEQLAAKFAYWGNRCWICGASAQAADHVKPLAKGGPHVLANIRPICKRCNSRKYTRWPYPLVRNTPRW